MHGFGVNLKLLTCTATNTYLPQVLTIISLPAEEDALTKLVSELAGQLNNVRSFEHVAAVRLTAIDPFMIASDNRDSRKQRGSARVIEPYRSRGGRKPTRRARS